MHYDPNVDAQHCRLASPQPVRSAHHDTFRDTSLVQEAPRAMSTGGLSDLSDPDEFEQYDYRAESPHKAARVAKQVRLLAAAWNTDRGGMGVDECRVQHAAAGGSGWGTVWRLQRVGHVIGGG